MGEGEERNIQRRDKEDTERRSAGAVGRIGAEGKEYIETNVIVRPFSPSLAEHKYTQHTRRERGAHQREKRRKKKHHFNLIQSPAYTYREREIESRARRNRRRLLLLLLLQQHQPSSVGIKANAPGIGCCRRHI